MEKVVSVIAVAAMAAPLLAGCNGSEGSSTTVAETEAVEATAATATGTTATETTVGTMAAPAVTENPVADKKVVYIMLLPSATIFQMWKGSRASLCDVLDVESDLFFCNGDFNKWQDIIRICAPASYDELLVSHSNQDGSYVFLREITKQYPDIKIVTSDTQFYSDGAYQKLPDAIQIFQQDKSLTTILLDQMVEKHGEGVRLTKAWRGPNYNSPSDRREVGWQGYEAASKIVTVGEVQPLRGSIDSVSTVAAVYPQSINRANVDGIVAYYDLYGQGVYNAIAENNNFNGKNGDAPSMAPVDIDPINMTNMQIRPDIWAAARATDWTVNSEIGVHILMPELTDQYDKVFDPVTGENSVGAVEVPGIAIKAGVLKPNSTAENLGNTAGETYGNLDYLPAAD